MSRETHEKSQARFPKVGKRMKNLRHVFPKLGNAYKISGTLSQSWDRVGGNTKGLYTF